MQLEEFFVISKSKYKEIVELIDKFVSGYEIYKFKSMPGYEFVDSYELDNFLKELRQKLIEPIKVKDKKQ